MGKWVRRLLWVVGSIAGALLLAWYPLVLHSPKPQQRFELDLAKIRALADSLPGSKPTEVRYERVMEMRFYESMVMAGDPWSATPMPVFSYQLVYADSTLIIDAALGQGVMPAQIVTAFDEAAFHRVNVALLTARQIVITHEHADHIGGLAVHPQLAELKPALRLTPEQLANPRGMEPLKLPAEALEGYQPFSYDGLVALAPGVVLIKAPGHTPGSQMVYVRRADGRELLFLGDVSWHTRNVEQVRERPLFMTLLIGEDRQAVLGQFAALNELARREPDVAQVPGHDGPAIERLATAGFMQAGFLQLRTVR